MRRRTKPSLAVHVRTFWMVAVLALSRCSRWRVASSTRPSCACERRCDRPAGGPVTKSAVIAAAHIDARCESVAARYRRDPRAASKRFPTSRRRRRIARSFRSRRSMLDVTLRAPTGCVRLGERSGHDRRDRARAADRLRLGRAAAGRCRRRPRRAPGEALTAPDIDRLLADARPIGDVDSGAHRPPRPLRRARGRRSHGRHAALRFGRRPGGQARLGRADPQQRRGPDAARRSTCVPRRPRSSNFHSPCRDCGSHPQYIVSIHI